MPSPLSTFIVRQPQPVTRQHTFVQPSQVVDHICPNESAVLRSHLAQTSIDPCQAVYRQRLDIEELLDLGGNRRRSLHALADFHPVPPNPAFVGRVGEQVFGKRTVQIEHCESVEIDNVSVVDEHLDGRLVV